MTKIYKTFAIETKEIDAEAGIFEAMITTEAVDRDGDIVLAEGADLKNFRKNPVVLADHRYMTDSVVAKSLKEEVIKGKGIKATFQFLERGISAKADMVREMWRAKFLNAVSIGFSVQNSEPLEAKNQGILFKAWELLEFSIVAVPANPDALQLAFKGMAGKEFSIEDVYKSFTHINFEDFKDLIISDSGDSVKDHWNTIQEFFHPDEILDLIKTVIPFRAEGTAPLEDAFSRPRLREFIAEGSFADLNDVNKRRIARHFTWTENQPPDALGNLKLPHHEAALSGVGRANFRGVVRAMSALLGARGGVDIPDADRRRVYNHLAKHYGEFDRDPPAFRQYTEEELKDLFGDLGEFEDSPTDDKSATPQDNEALKETSELLKTIKNTLKEKQTS